MNEYSQPADLELPPDSHGRDLRAHIENLELALNTMAHGLCLFDHSGRLKLSNARYAEMYGLDPAAIKVGSTLAEMLHLRKAKGGFVGDADAFAADVMARNAAGKQVETTTELADGRVILVTSTPTPGGGWVATHRDITARVRAERERDRTRNFLDMVIGNVPAVVIVKDARTFRYLLINKRAEEYLGFAGFEVIGKTAGELFPPERANAIRMADEEVIRGEQRVEYTGAPLHHGNSQQVIFTKRQVIRDSHGEPEYLISIIEDVTERTKSAESVAHMARHDALTGLGNRILFSEKIAEALLGNDGAGIPFNLILLDLDQFKNINDSLGHPIGDRLLKSIAERLKALVSERDTVVRLSGDEFAIMQIADGDQREAAIDLASRILDSILEPFEIDGHTLIIGTSIGIALAPEHGGDADELSKCADLALYRAKFAGRNQFCFFESKMEQDVQVRRTLELELRNAISGQQFELRYQPIMAAANKQICGAEALLRWNSPTRGFISPERYISLAEETGLIIPLGDWVMRQACRDAAAWPSGIKVAVNLSATQFSKGDLVGLVSGALVDSGLAPERLELEITESVLLQKNEDNIALLHALKDLGVSIVLDDFGTGYSSLGYLKMFPFNKIKIDKSFVNEMTTRMDCAAIVCAVAGLGRSLNIDTTAEGVETAEQMTLLRAVGCTQIQGYLFGHPVAASELASADPDTAAARSEAPPAAILPPAANEPGLPRQIA